MSACFESASLDTNILIHLWKSGTEAMLGQMFGKAYVYQWLLDVELCHHADESLRERIFTAMDTGFLEPVDNRELKERGLYDTFKEAYADISMFFSGPDIGEGYAIALARAFGIPVLVTDDTKKEGPKWYLNLRAQKPFGFSSDEVLVVNYLQGEITEEEYLRQFKAVNEANGLNWRPKVCLDRFERRFLGDVVPEAHGSLRDHKWIEDFAGKFHVDVEAKLKKLRASLPTESMAVHIPRTREELLLSDYSLGGAKDAVDIRECYRRLYKFIRGRKMSLEVSEDIVIACVMERMGYGQGEIEETIAALAPGAESNPMYHRLVVMRGKGFEDEGVIGECWEAVRDYNIGK